MSETTLLAISRTIDLIVAVSELTAKLSKASEVIQRARAEGRDISEDEWKALDAELVTAKSRAKAALDNA